MTAMLWEDAVAPHKRRMQIIFDATFAFVPTSPSDMSSLFHPSLSISLSQFHSVPNTPKSITFFGSPDVESWVGHLLHSPPFFFVLLPRSIHLSVCGCFFFQERSEVGRGEKEKKLFIRVSFQRRRWPEHPSDKKRREREDARLKSPLTFVLRGRQERKDRMSHFLPGQSSLRLWVGKLLLSVPFLDSKLPLHTESR